jgi:predicted RNA-binding Zn ribbon-like protein
VSDPGGGWAAGDLPLLGEPIAVELANSLYGDGDDRVDFLGTPELAGLWLAHAALPVPFPERPTAGDLERLRRLRDAVRTLIDAAIDGGPPPPGAVATVNRTVRRAPPAAQLAGGGAGPTGVAWVPGTGRGVDAALGAVAAVAVLAHEAVVLLGTAATSQRLRRCRAPGCGLVFVQHHGRRRWCHDSCGHRVRQAAYQRRTAAATVEATAARGRSGPTPGSRRASPAAARPPSGR